VVKENERWETLLYNWILWCCVLFKKEMFKIWWFLYNWYKKCFCLLSSWLNHVG